MAHHVAWFSCGTSSATATMIHKAALPAGDILTIARCVVPEEHPDNDRFAADCEQWFDQPIVNLRSTEYESCEDVWIRRAFMSGPHGAVCSREMKKVVRWALEQDALPDFQVFGYTTDEADRANDFRKQNPDVKLLTPLITAGLSKYDCHAIVTRAGIALPAMYRLGFPNANCRGCVNAQSPTYWNLTREVFPDVFAARAILSRKLGVRLVKATTGKRERMFLDELDPSIGRGATMPNIDCSLLCHIAEQKIGEAA